MKCPMKRIESGIVSFFMALAILLLVSSCHDDPEELSDDCNILSFKIARMNNPGLTGDVSGVIDQSSLHVSLLFQEETEVNRLIPTIEVSPGAVVSPASGTPVDFSNPVTFTVTAPSGVMQRYMVSISTPTGVPLLTGLQINRITCPYDQTTETYFFSLSATSSGNIRILCLGQNIDAFSLGGITSPNDGNLTLPGFKPGATLELTPVGKTGLQGKPVKVTVTSLPLVIIEANGAITDGPKADCMISVIDPSGKTNDSLFYFLPHRAGIETRGGVSQTFPKKSYSFELRKPTGTEEVDEGTRLLGLRDDGDWILDAMYVDHARMRNRLSTDLWIAINKVPHSEKEPDAVNGTRGFFTEVFLNNSYMGIYCLTERVDRKQLHLSKSEGFSYKASYWSNSTEFISGDAVFSNNSDTWDGWELEYQSETGAASSPPVRWEPLRNFIRFTSLSANTDFATHIATRFDIPNLVDYLLFMNAIGADDNTGKNTYFSFHGNSRNKFFITPWDIDASWGSKWDGSKIDLREGEFVGVTGVPGANTRYCRPNAWFVRMMESNPAGFRMILKQRWASLRGGELSMPQLTARVEAYKSQFDTSGAWTRETMKWPGSVASLESETQYMLQWIETRMNQVDHYMDGL